MVWRMLSSHCTDDSKRAVAVLAYSNMSTSLNCKNYANCLSKSNKGTLQLKHCNLNGYGKPFFFSLQSTCFSGSNLHHGALGNLWGCVHFAFHLLVGLALRLTTLIDIRVDVMMQNVDSSAWVTPICTFDLKLSQYPICRQFCQIILSLSFLLPDNYLACSARLFSCQVHIHLSTFFLTKQVNMIFYCYSRLMRQILWGFCQIILSVLSCGSLVSGSA